MQVILLEKIAKLGQLGDVVNVKPGYARNFLLPKKKAKRASQANLKEFEVVRADLERQQQAYLETAEKLAAELSTMTVLLQRKSSVDGRLFGSVNQNDIADALVAQGFSTLHKSMVRMPLGPIKIIGEHEVSLVLHADVSLALQVKVTPEQ